MQQEHGVESRRSDGARPNILIVDDRPENHRVIKRILHEVEATFHYAHSGKEGWRWRSGRSMPLSCSM